MKLIRSLIIITFFFSLPFLTHASTSYYVSNSGNDSNNGTSTSTPWQSITKVNAATLSPGDSVLFNRGDTFYGTLQARSGTTSNPVVYDTYGTGNKPVLTGFKTLSTWTNEGGGIYSAPP